MTATLTASYAVMDKAGLLDSTISSWAVIDRFINQAEGEICAQLRCDVITKFSGLPIYAQYVIQEACSNLAAIYLANKYKSSYPTMRAAETTLDVCYNHYNIAMQNIKQDANVKKFLEVESNK